jgi:hypothetical protein
MTNFSVACCLTTHNTEFAGGLVTLPSAIDFNDVFANASFLQNPTIYVTVILMGALYAALAIYAMIMDRRDSDRISFTMCTDTSSKHDYFYEVIFFTGTRKDAQCDSNVNN